VEKSAGSQDLERTMRPVPMGVLVVDKPSGLTSRAVVDLVAHEFPSSRVGHAGTLDPLASGILILCVGPATRLIAEIQKTQKAYRTVLRLGARSDTCDADGTIQAESSPSIPTAGVVERALVAFEGILHQVPPEYSAVKVKGRRAYELARAGQRPELQPRPVRVDRVALIAYDWPKLALEIQCASGTYIRSIARDLGERLGCGAYVETLVRTRIEPFGLEDAVDLRALSGDSIHRHMRPVLDALPHLPRLSLQPEQLADVAHGRRLLLPQPAGASLSTGPIALLAPDGQLVALAELNAQEGWAQPRKVLVGH
jgi:tRNA pseudouridine55 synthase